eukprot:gene1137-32494_t
MKIASRASMNPKWSGPKSEMGRSWEMHRPSPMANGQRGPTRANVKVQRFVVSHLKPSTYLRKGHKIPEFKGLTGKTLLKSLHARIGETLYAATQVIPNLTAIPNILSEYNGYNGKERLLLDPSAKASVGKDVSVQMTSKGYFTFMHADPCDSGGGWVYGLQGVKNWIYLPTHYLDEQDERMTE